MGLALLHIQRSTRCQKWQKENKHGVSRPGRYLRVLDVFGRQREEKGKSKPKKKALKLQIGCGCCYDDAEEIIKVEILWQVVPPERRAMVFSELAAFGKLLHAESLLPFCWVPAGVFGAVCFLS